MNYKRIGRALICLILVCALLVNVSPIKAEAVAIESALGIGLCAMIILGSVGMIYTGLTTGQIQGLGDAFTTHMYQWGTSAEKLDEVDEFIGGLTLYNGSGDGDDDDDNDWDKRFRLTDATKAAVAMFAAEAIAMEGIDIYDRGMNAPDGMMYYGEQCLADLSRISGEFGDLSVILAYGNSTGTYLCVSDASDIHLNDNGTLFLGHSENGNQLYYIKYQYVKSTNYWRRIESSSCLSMNLSCDWYFVGEPSSNPALTLKTGTYVGDIPEGVKNGSLELGDIQLPDTFDLSSIAAANPDLQVGVTDLLQQVADGTITYEDYLSRFEPAVVPDPVPDPEPEPEPEPIPQPSENPFPDLDPDVGGGTIGDTNANTFLEKLGAYITSPFEWIWENLDTKLDTLSPPEFDFDKLGDYVTAPAEWIWPKLQTFFEPLLNPDTLLSPLPDILEVPFRKTWEYVQAIPQEIADASKALQTKIEAIPEKLAELGTKIQAIPDAVAEAAAQVKTAVEEAAEKAVVPEKDYLTDKVRALQEEFVFADSIVKTGQVLKKGLANISTEPPVIYIHLEDTEGSYNIGGTVPFLDLRWYARYKPTVDTLISAFLWICFVWRMLVKLPGIISGMPGDFVMASAHHMGVAEHLPTRTKEYEIQRISNREMIRKGPGK